MGIKKYPPLQKILTLAAPPTDPEIRNRALKYFINNFERRYYYDYNPAQVNAFLPCLDSYIYAKPSECYTNIGCKIMNFQVVRHYSIKWEGSVFVNILIMINS